jgi:hypothetical protein
MGLNNLKEAMTRETVGKVSSQLLQKQPETKSPIEQTRENLTDYEKNIWECAERCKKDYPGDFYIVVITKNEKLMPNVFRNFFYGRLSCPTPDYDKTVYKFKRKDNGPIFMWVIPSRDACFHLKDNALQVADEERELLKYVLAFEDGTLMRLAKDLNGEKELTSELREN